MYMRTDQDLRAQRSPHSFYLVPNCAPSHGYPTSWEKSTSPRSAQVRDRPPLPPLGVDMYYRRKGRFNIYFPSIGTNQSSLLLIKIKCKMLGACICEDMYHRLRIIGIVYSSNPPFFSVHRSLPHPHNTTSKAKAWGPHTRTFLVHPASVLSCAVLLMS